MVALPNTPFGDDAYLKKYGVKIRQTPPAFYHHEHPPEQLMEDLNNVVVGSNVMTFEDYIDALWMEMVHYNFSFFRPLENFVIRTEK